MRSIQELLSDFPNCVSQGLSSEEVERSKQQFGLNRLTPLPREPLWKQFVGRFDEPIIRILLAASLLKIVVDLFLGSLLWGAIGFSLSLLVVALVFFPRFKALQPVLCFVLAAILVLVSSLIGHLSFEGLAIMVAVILATGVAFFSEWKSAREFDLLNARKDSQKCRTIRNGEIGIVASEDTYVGDLIEIHAGDEIPADGRVVQAQDLRINQSLLTGESEPVAKIDGTYLEDAEGTEHPACVYRGTQVVEGVGRVLITDVGDMTMIGQIARQLSLVGSSLDEESALVRVHRKLTVQKHQTPLQRKLSHLADLISKLGYAAAVLIFLAMLIRGYLMGEWKLSFAGADLRASLAAILEYFVYMVVVVVVAVPEGLPMSVSVSLALAMRKMTRANCHVRQLMACETIGSVSVICSDKTGTITLNEMRVDHVWTPESTNQPSERIVLNAALNSTAHLDPAAGDPSIIGSSTEGALLLWLKENQVDYRKVREEHAVLYQTHFDSQRKDMRSVVRLEGVVHLMIKGAPEMLLAASNRVRSSQGEILELTPALMERIERSLLADSQRSMRTLAFAHTIANTDPSDESFYRNLASGELSNLIFDGYAAIRDPIRPDVSEAIRQCRVAGIEVKMITGDNPETARAIGQEIGLLEAESLLMTSEQFGAASNEQLKAQLPKLRILARAKPQDKLRMVRLLQEMQQVVAVTGDGTNDAPALKQADVGLAMGRTGTEVAKEASNIVLLDDSFSSIVQSIHWGRALYENIQRFLQFQLTINVSALILALLGPFLGVKPPFTVLQLLWINVIMDTFAAIALCSERPRPGLMKCKPIHREANILTRAMRWRILGTAGFFVVAMLILLVGMKYDHLFYRSQDNPSNFFGEFTRRQVAIFFTTYVMFQLWNQLNCRSLAGNESAFYRLFQNPFFLGISAMTLGVQISIINYGGAIFDVEPLSGLEWLLIVVGTASVLLFGEILRRVVASSGASRE